MLTLNQVSKKYGDFIALEKINLSFQQGVYALLAPNGAGKTTLIKLLTTLIFPTKGEILWKGEDIVKLGANYRDLIGYLPQEFGYYKNHTPTEFLNYISALKGMDRETSQKRVMEVIEEVGLTSVKNKKMKKFSGGMIQRVGIAQAILNDPQILILDEPTVGLDPKERVRFRNLIGNLGRNRIVILSTHIVSDIETIAEQVILIKNQQIYLHETPEKICEGLHGQVYETTKLKDVTLPYLPLMEVQSGGQRVSRFMSQEDCTEVATPVEPNLEDVFLTIYQEETL